MSLKFLRPIFMLFVSALWCALVWFVQNEVGTQGTASIFALVSFAVGMPGIVAVASVQCLAFMFIALDGGADEGDPSGFWFLYCFICWAGCAADCVRAERYGEVNV